MPLRPPTRAVAHFLCKNTIMFRTVERQGRGTLHLHIPLDFDPHVVLPTTLPTHST